MSDQSIKETFLMIILLIQRKKTFILAQIINYISTNPFWTPIKLRYYLPYLTAAALAHPTLNTPSIDYSPFLHQTRMYGPIDLPRQVALECMPYNPNEIPSTLFLC